MLRARSAAFTRAAILAVLLSPFGVAVAHADNSWPAGTEAVVQLREGNQLPAKSSSIHDLLAQAYGYTHATINGPNTGATLRYRIQSTSRTDVALSILDFDRDGVPDVLVESPIKVDNQGGSNTTTARAYSLAGSGTTTTCLKLPPESKLLFTADVQTPDATEEGVATATTDVSRLSETIDANLLRYAPRLLTILASSSLTAPGSTGSGRSPSRSSSRTRPSSSSHP